MYWKFYKINLNVDGSYIDSPDWMRNKKAMANLVIDDDKSFQDAATVTLNYKEIGKV